jgi:1-acyl-sn-glycerol-3-phosphate acyltransferase
MPRILALDDELKHARWEWWLRRWARGQLKIFGADLVMPAPRPPPARGARLVVSNHRSPLDVAILVSIFGGRVLARADLAEWPVVGMAARRAGTIFVDRDKEASGANAIRAIRRSLASGNTVHVFPEGTTGEGDDVLPFRGGAFAAVGGLDVEIVSVGLAYPPGVEFTEASFFGHILRVAGRPAPRVGVVIGTPRRPGRVRASALAAELEEEVQTLVTAARRATE